MGASLSPAVMLDAIRREKDRRAASASLYEFVKQAWSVVEPGVKFIESWHIQVICEHLEAISAGELRVVRERTRFQECNGRASKLRWAFYRRFWAEGWSIRPFCFSEGR